MATVGDVVCGFSFQISPFGAIGPWCGGYTASPPALFDALVLLASVNASAIGESLAILQSGTSMMRDTGWFKRTFFPHPG